MRSRSELGRKKAEAPPTNMKSAISCSRPRLVLTNALLSQVGRRTSGVGFRGVTTAGALNKPDEKKRDVASDSYGEGYASRCDEEGFGRLSGDDEDISDTGKDQSVKADHPDFDKTQGSEVKEREGSRHQKTT